jgi:deuterolysin
MRIVLTPDSTVYSPGTDDLGYGYDAIMRLDSWGRINNADTYAMFANAVWSGC